MAHNLLAGPSAHAPGNIGKGGRKREERSAQLLNFGPKVARSLRWQSGVLSPFWNVPKAADGGGLRAFSEYTQTS
jgi:hypothetical protein